MDNDREKDKPVDHCDENSVREKEKQAPGSTYLESLLQSDY